MTVTKGKKFVDLDPIGLETYGYPKIDLLGKGTDGKAYWLRVSYGWFFKGEDENENATYFDIYISSKGEISIVLDDMNIHFDFVTPLDDYILPFCKTATIGDLYKKEEAIVA